MALRTAVLEGSGARDIDCNDVTKLSHYVVKLINPVEAGPEIGENVSRVLRNSDFFGVLVEPALDGLEADHAANA